ncbi:NCS2 family permease [Agarilytica rhodophyticola]|uniref:NCS2 family permease n=1 Tax=Agarilytica rhodophyticola TaxID=1737490 RepID=UPI000B342D37|nr:NCS2 family permease [Agarilytica rhodophyticola]
MEYISRYFQLDNKQSTYKKEVIAGITTFLAMAYITVVNPAMLSQTGMDFGAVFFATCVAAAFGSIVMGVMGNYPIALAPGMGQNAFFTYGVVLGMGHTWQVALGAVFISGILFIILSVLPVREWLINAIPRNLKLGISTGIGLFLGIIALTNAKVVVDSPATLVQLGDLTSFEPFMCLIGFAIIATLVQKKIIGAVIIGMLLTTLVGWLTGYAEFKGIVSLPPSPAPVFLSLDLAGAFDVTMITVIITLLIVDVFDTAGTLVGVATRADMVNKDGSLPRLGKALLADSGATTFGAVMGTSSTTSFIESATGVEAGGRTGLTAIICGVLFLLCLFFSPLAQSVPSYASAAALLFVACLMTKSAADIDWHDYSESAPAIITAISMPLGYSIADGIGLGFITYALIKVFSFRLRECPLVVYVAALIFTGKFIFL